MLFEEGKNKNTIPASPCQVAGHLLMANFQSIAAIMEGTDFQQGRYQGTETKCQTSVPWRGVSN